jgi:hypothetical protein
MGSDLRPLPQPLGIVYDPRLRQRYAIHTCLLLSSSASHLPQTYGIRVAHDRSANLATKLSNTSETTFGLSIPRCPVVELVRCPHSLTSPCLDCRTDFLPSDRSADRHCHYRQVIIEKSRLASATVDNHRLYSKETNEALCQPLRQSEQLRSREALT